MKSAKLTPHTLNYGDVITMNEEERKAHMEKDAKVMKQFIRSVLIKTMLFLLVVLVGVIWMMYDPS